MRTVVGLYDRIEDAHGAVRDLRAAGFESDNISLVTRDENGEYSRQIGGEGRMEEFTSGTMTGAAAGGALGGLGGLLVGLGALAIPGIGPVVAAGPIATTLAGAGIGAAAGGILGALTGMGVPEDQSHYYAEGIRRGGTLVVLRCEDHLSDRAVSVMNRYNPVDVDRRVEGWRAENWRGFDEKAQPWERGREYFTGERLERQERERQERMSTTPAPMPVTGEELDSESSFQQDVDKPAHDEGDIPVTGMDADTGMRGESDIPVTGRDRDTGLRGEDEIPVTGRDVDYTGGLERESQFEKDMESGLHDEEIPVTGSIDVDYPRVEEDIHVRSDVEEGYRTFREDMDVERTYEQLRGAPEWESYEPRFREHFTTYYGATGDAYDTFQPAYLYGYELAGDTRYRDYNWDRLENDARMEWERRGSPHPWEHVRDAVRHAWDVMRGMNR